MRAWLKNDDHVDTSKASRSRLADLLRTCERLHLLRAIYGNLPTWSFMLVNSIGLHAQHTGLSFGALQAKSADLREVPYRQVINYLFEDFLPTVESRRYDMPSIEDAFERHGYVFVVTRCRSSDATRVAFAATLQSPVGIISSVINVAE